MPKTMKTTQPATPEPAEAIAHDDGDIEAKRLLASVRDTAEACHGMLSRLVHGALAVRVAAEGREQTRMEMEALYLASLAERDAVRVDLTRASAARALGEAA
jgi:hypothetical protein